MKIKTLAEAFHIIDEDETSICIVYFSEDPGHAGSAKRLMKDGAKAVAIRIARFLDRNTRYTAT